MNRKRRNLILLLFLLFVLLLGAWLYFGKAEEPEVQVPEPVVQEEVAEQKRVPAKTPAQEQQVKVVQKQRDQGAELIAIAKSFAERYGSYSNQSDFANLKDVQAIMTEAFARETQLFIETASTGTEYYGVTTRIISLDVEEQGEEEARLRLSTQREEASGSPQNVKVRYQDLMLVLRKVGTGWQVAAADWQ